MISGTLPDTILRTRGTIHPFRNGPSGGPFLLGHEIESMVKKKSFAMPNQRNFLPDKWHIIGKDTAF